MRATTTGAFVFCLSSLVYTSLPAMADVLDQSAGGFTIAQKVVVPVTAAAASSRFVDVAAWWGNDHTFSGSATNLKLDASAGGCFCESLANGGSVAHLRVVTAEPGELLRLVGAMGPLQSMAVQGALSVAFKSVDGGTEVTLSYAVGGYLPGGLEPWASRVDGMFGGQMQQYRQQFPEAAK